MPSQEFTEAAEAVQKLPTKPNSGELLKLYGLYKQATVGDNTSEKPGVFAFEAKMKWQAWEDNKGLSQEEAEQKYVALVKELQATYGSN